MAKGGPWASQIKWRVLPLLALSVGFGPVSSPQKPHAPNGYRQQHATSRSDHHARGNPAMRSGSNPKFHSAASPAIVASRSYLSRTPVFSAASARGHRFGARK